LKNKQVGVFKNWRRLLLMILIWHAVTQRSTKGHDDFLGEFGLAAKKMQEDIVTEALFYWGYWPGKAVLYESSDRIRMH
jgi:hypothetical protein